jgi:hypothetical protein
MHLMHGDQPVDIQVEPAAHPCAVFDHVDARSSLRAEPDVEAIVKSLGDAAGAVEETMGDPAVRGQAVQQCASHRGWCVAVNRHELLLP